MKITGFRNVCIIFFLIFVLLLSNSIVIAQQQKESSFKGLIRLQFSVTISWDANETSHPISPGETRESNLDVTYVVNKGLLGGLLLRLLEGRSFPIQLSIVEKPEWCEAWSDPENMAGVVNPEEIEVQHSSLFIHVNEDAPTNYTIGELKIRCIIDNVKGPFNILTLIYGFEQISILNFQTGP